MTPLRVRWLGRVPYGEAADLQSALWRGTADHLLLLEHPPVYTLGVRADPAHVLVDPASVGAELVKADRGGDVTYHGPGQLVGYPVLSVPGHRPSGGERTGHRPSGGERTGQRAARMAGTAAWVRLVRVASKSRDETNSSLARARNRRCSTVDRL